MPGLLVWPDVITEPREVDMPAVTSDYFPTVMDVNGFSLPKPQTRPYDGVGLLPLMRSEMEERPRPIGFHSRDQMSLTDNRYKIYSSNSGRTFELYDLIEDLAKADDLAKEKPKIPEAMRVTFEAWKPSCEASECGKDY